MSESRQAWTEVTDPRGDRSRPIAFADRVGRWSTEGYRFEHSAAVLDGDFVGLVLDRRQQPLLTEPRIDAWLEQVRPLCCWNAAWRLPEPWPPTLPRWHRTT